MSMTGTWVGGEEDLAAADLWDFVPTPATVAEAASLAEVFAAQVAGWDPAGDPDFAEYWQDLDDITATLAGEPASGWAGEEVGAGLAGAARGLGRAGLWAQDMVHVFDTAVVGSMEAVGRVRSQLDALALTLALEASRRGLHTGVGLSLVDWLRARCPWMSLSEASQLRVVVDAAGTHWGAPLAEALVAGRTGLHRGAQVARTMHRLAGSLDSEQREAYAAIITAAATNLRLSDAGLSRACAKLLVDLLDGKPEDHGDAGAGGSARDLRSVSRRGLGRGMTRYTLDAPQDDAALLDGILKGALARPVPGEDGSADPRPAGVRGDDAVMTVLGRGLGNPGAPPSAARASVVVTVRADPATGRPQGAAFTQTGQVFPASAAGRFACTGDLTPVVLGQHGEPLALGRTQRLASAGQFRALLVRDEQCVYPGCSVPGTWCDAHHVRWWSRGGATDVGNLALLCQRHHTLVHDKDVHISVRGGLATVHV